jgi:hypothetical protein
MDNKKIDRILNDIFSSILKSEDDCHASAQLHLYRAIGDLMKLCPEYETNNPDFLNLIKDVENINNLYQKEFGIRM